MNGNILNSKGVHVGVVVGDEVFGLKGQKLYDLKGSNIFQLANSPSGENLACRTLGLINTASAALSSSGLEVKK